MDFLSAAMDETTSTLAAAYGRNNFEVLGARVDYSDGVKVAKVRIRFLREMAAQYDGFPFEAETWQECGDWFCEW